MALWVRVSSVCGRPYWLVRLAGCVLCYETLLIHDVLCIPRVLWHIPVRCRRHGSVNWGVHILPPRGRGAHGGGWGDQHVVRLLHVMPVGGGGSVILGWRGLLLLLLLRLGCLTSGCWWWLTGTRVRLTGCRYGRYVTGAVLIMLHDLLAFRPPILEPNFYLETKKERL